AEHKTAQCRTGRESERAHDGPAEAWIGQHLLEKVETDELRVPPGAEVYRPLMKRKIKLQQKHRHQQKYEQRDQRQQERKLELPDRAAARSAACRCFGWCFCG